MRRAADLQVRSEELTQQSSILWSLIARTQQPAESAADWTAFAGSSVLAQNQTISDIVGKLTTLEIERSRMLAGRTAAEAQVANLTGIIAGLRSQLRTLAGSTLQGLDDEKRSVQATLERSDARLAVVPEKQLQFARLTRQVESNNELYGMLQKRLKEAEVSEASEVAGVSVVDPAIVPTAPLGGRRFFNLLFGVALSFLCGGLVALARESADTRVRSREELVRLTELPLLASIPRMRLTNGFRREAAGRIEGRLVLRHAPRSPAAEAYRALRTNVAFAGNGNRQPLKSIVVTSAEPMDGKTTTAVNLSVTLAEQGHRVVLIEADQRRPVLHKVLHTERAPGLSDLLVGAAPLERTLHAAIKKVTQAVTDLRFNTAISEMMVVVNEATKATAIPRAWFEMFVKILSPFAPHLCEELWQRLGHRDTITFAPWPAHDEAKLARDTMVIGIQVSGKLRSQIEVPVDATEQTILAAAKADDKVQPFLAGKPIKREIYVKGRLVNLVV